MADPGDLPQGFTDLATAYQSAASGNAGFFNIIGTVVDLMPAITNAKTGQWQMTFTLNDQHLINTLNGSKGLQVRFFRQDLAKIPQIHGHGDVVLLRSLKVHLFSGQPIGLSNYQTNFVVFPAQSIPAPNFSITYAGTQKLNCLAEPAEVKRLSLKEQMYIIQFKADMEPLLDRERQLLAPPPGAPTGPSPQKRPITNSTLPDSKKAKLSRIGPKFKLIEELSHLMFADMCVEVVKKYPANFGNTELYVTDYTSNSLMWYYPPPDEQNADHVTGERDGDAYGYSNNSSKRQKFPGPYQQRVLKVNLKPPHSEYANASVTEGQIVLLQNVKCKLMPTGGKLEGDMWPDQLYTDRVKMKIQHDHETPEIMALKERKEKYWKNLPKPIREVKEEEEREAARRKKREKKKAPRKERRAQLQSGQQQIKEKPTPSEGQQPGNKHVRCSHDEVPLTTLAGILDDENVRHTNIGPNGSSYVLPFVNARYRSKVRVVDFEPEDIQDFATIPEPTQEERSEFSQNVDWNLTPTWEWSFSLLVEDAMTRQTEGTEKSHLWLTVGHEEAQFLLGNDMPDPSDLRQDSRLLAKLKEQLYILWGDLEEIKARQTQEKLSNTPLECCIEEYGQPLDDDDDHNEAGRMGYLRMYRMFGATIL